MSRIVKIKATFEQLRATPAQSMPVLLAAPGSSGENGIYRPLPRYFTAPSQWPSTSNLHCWECDQLPSGYPRFIAMSKIRTETGTDLYCVRGVFHDWCCAAKHIKIHYGERASDLLELLCEVEYKFSGRRRLNMVESASKYLMKQFIGDENGISVDQWNKMNERRTAEGTIYIG